MLVIQNEQSQIGSSLADFQMIKELGRGSYGVVYLVKPLNSKEI